MPKRKLVAFMAVAVLYLRLLQLQQQMSEAQAGGFYGGRATNGLLNLWAYKTRIGSSCWSRAKVII
jgi:hypothetical protein